MWVREITDNRALDVETPDRAAFPYKVGQHNDLFTFYGMFIEHIIGISAAPSFASHSVL